MENKDKVLNEEVVAAISAAIASIAASTGSRLVVRNIRRLPQTAPVWSAAGRMERLRNDRNASK